MRRVLVSRGGPRPLVTVLRTYLTISLGCGEGLAMAHCVDGNLCGAPYPPTVPWPAPLSFSFEEKPSLIPCLAVLVWTDTGLEPGHTTPNGNQGENAVYVHWVLDSQGSLVTTIVSPVGRARQRVRTAQGRAGLRDGPRVTVLKPVPQPRSSGFSPLQ